MEATSCSVRQSGAGEIHRTSRAVQRRAGREGKRLKCTVQGNDGDAVIMAHAGPAPVRFEMTTDLWYKVCVEIPYRHYVQPYREAP